MINFFVNWELWQQMTFVLAAAIVVVFFAGLVKLWWLSRFLKKHTVLDLEKRARQQEMQKSGLPMGKRVDIPFGVRAIQSGIEVDGIWISRPGTPIEVGQSSPSFASSSTLETESKLKGKERELAATVIEVESTPEQSPQPIPPVSLSEKHISASVDPTQVRAFPLGAQPTYRPRGPSRRRTGITPDEISDDDAISGLQQNVVRHQEVETYLPTDSFSSTESSASSQQRTMVERSSTSSDEGVNHSSMRYVSHLRQSAMHTPRTLNSFENPDAVASNIDYFSNVPADQQRVNPFETPSVGSQSVPQPLLAVDRPMPHRSYSGGSHANTSSRRINAGFEVLPAGTFNRPNSQIDMEDRQPRRNTNNKLQKRSRDRSSREGPIARC